jgi:hypothetical protein
VFTQRQELVRAPSVKAIVVATRRHATRFLP